MCAPDARVPRSEGAGHRIGPTLGGSCKQAAFGAEENACRKPSAGSGKVFEGDHQLPGLRVGGHRPGELDVGGKAVGDEEDAVAVAGQRLAEEDETRQRARQGRAVDLEAPDLGELRALRRTETAEARLGVAAGGLAVGGVGG